MTRTMILTLALIGAVTPTRNVYARHDDRPRVSREEVTRLIDDYLVKKIQERLDLTSEQYTRIMPLIRQLQSDRRHYARKRIEALRKLRRLLEKGVATEQRITTIVRELRAAEAEEPITIRKDMEAIDSILSPIQQAKYRVLEFEVERKIHDLRRRVRRRLAPSENMRQMR